MRTAFQIVAASVSLWLACGYPFASGFRHTPIGKTTLKSWGALVIYFAFLSFLLPMAVSAGDREWGKEMLRTWVPEGPGVVGIAVVGWVPPLIFASVGLTARKVAEMIWPRRFLHAESPGG